MTSTQTAPAGHTAESVLAGIETASRRQAQAVVDVFVGAALWADVHPGLDPAWVVRFHRDEDVALNSDEVRWSTAGAWPSWVRRWVGRRSRRGS